MQFCFLYKQSLPNDCEKAVNVFDVSKKHAIMCD